ncbi:hypothetical protein [Pseudoxanthomonas japonensis]|uniref:hypothetical protein n=1 Tax=Pseudoxanthomonas japonensis TaxID=69284 RepID=UPI001BCE0974|nr:hypothetical protein [Pseudoxanthomonas japonensis]
MKIISLLIVLTIVLAPTHASAQSALEPCEMEFLGDYYRGVDKIIDDAVGDTPRLSLTTLPSFSPESGVRLVGDHIYFVQFGSSFWYGATTVDHSGRGHEEFSSPKVEIRMYRARVSQSIAERIEQAFATAIKSSRKSDRMGLDGVSYRFTKPGLGCGEAWSPDPNTPNARLVELIDVLAKHAKLSESRKMQRSEDAITALLDRVGR